MKKMVISKVVPTDFNQDLKLSEAGCGPYRGWLKEALVPLTFSTKEELWAVVRDAKTQRDYKIELDSLINGWLQAKQQEVI